MFTKTLSIQQLIIISLLLFGCSPTDIATVPIHTASPEQIQESPFSGIPCEL
jgi:hypothetical protein